MNIVEKAELFARGAHVGQRYGAAADYSVHLAAVVEVLKRFHVGNDVLLAAAWLHDTLEDTAAGADTIEQMFGWRVYNLVQAVTNGPGANRRERWLNTYPKILRAGNLAILLKLADRIANVEASLQDVSGGKHAMYRKEYEAFRGHLYTVLDESSILAEMWRHLDKLLRDPVPSKKHRLVTVGPLGMKRAYLDVSREEAVRRFLESREGGDASDVTEFEFTDEFYTYEAGSLGGSAVA